MRVPRWNGICMSLEWTPKWLNMAVAVKGKFSRQLLLSGIICLAWQKSVDRNTSLLFSGIFEACHNWNHLKYVPGVYFRRWVLCIQYTLQKSLATLHPVEWRGTSIYWNGHNIANTACMHFKFGTMNNRFQPNSKPLKIEKTCSPN